MAISRSLSALDLYDVLANLIPGILLLFSVFLLFPIEKYAVPVNPALATGGIIALSFVIGHIIQYYASKWSKNPTLFGEIMRTVRFDEGEVDGPHEVDPNNTTGSKPQVSITYIESESWPLMKDRFALPDDFDDYGALFRLLLSYIESTPASRALRFQALQSLFRSLWATGIILLAFVAIAVLLQFSFDSMSRGFPYIILILLASIVFIYVFGNRMERFNELFVQYAIADFYAFETQD